MKMKKIKGGTFMMGTNSEEGFLDDFEGPQVAVSVKDFSIADTPVTNQEFAQFVKETGYKTLAERQEWSFVFILDLFGNCKKCYTIFMETVYDKAQKLNSKN
ncbi:formylglycine-generating enzyme family protein, partial [Streptococcus pneumoniae]